MSAEFLANPQDIAIEGQIKDIYHKPLTDEERVIINGAKNEIVKATDIGGVLLYKDLRSSLEDLDTDEGWKTIKEEARRELSTLPETILEDLFVKFAPFIKNLPAGHSRGHFFRDAIHLTGIFQDPAFRDNKSDEVELFTGILGGMFHDIGNSIVSRYDDVKRLGAHAEVGSVLFGNFAKDVLPPQLTKLAQYTIAAHTHYPPNQEVTLETGEKVTRQNYNDNVSPEDDRLSIWLTRQTDRRDTSNVAFLFRNYILKTKPLSDFDGMTFDAIRGEEENFRIQYSLDPEYLDQKGVITHCVNFAKNIFDSSVPYTTLDSPFFTRTLMTPGLADLAQFLDIVAPDKKNEFLAGIERNENAAIQKGKWPISDGESSSSERIRQTLEQKRERLEELKKERLSPAMIEGALERFIQLVQVIEPASDLDSLTESLRTQFLGGEIIVGGQKRKVEPLLSQQSQERLARGFLLLSGPLFEEWRERLFEQIKNNPELSTKITSTDTKTQQILGKIGTHLQTIANQELSEMNFPERKTKSLVDEATR